MWLPWRSPNLLIKAINSSDSVNSTQNNTIVYSSSSSISVNSTQNNTSVSNSTACKPFFAAPWHARLGHPSIDVMRHVFQICKIPTINKNISDFCSHCCLSKSPRLPSSPSLSVYSGPFELVFTYLWGPTPFLSSTGYKYYVSFVDANTRFTWIYLLKN